MNLFLTFSVILEGEAKTPRILDDSTFLLVRNEAVERDGDELVEHAIARPVEFHHSWGGGGGIRSENAGLDEPEGFGNEVLRMSQYVDGTHNSLQIALHDEAERGKLTGTIGHDRIDAQHVIANEERLESGERTPDSQIDFLSRVCRLGLVLVGRRQCANCLEDVVRNQGGEVRSFLSREAG